MVLLLLYQIYGKDGWIPAPGVNVALSDSVELQSYFYRCYLSQSIN